MSIIAPISSSAPSWKNSTVDVNSSFSTTHAKGVTDENMLDAFMSKAVEMEGVENKSQAELNSLDVTDATDQMRGKQLFHESIARLTVVKKCFSSVEAAFQKTVISPQ